MRHQDEIAWLIGLVIVLIVICLMIFYVVLVGCPPGGVVIPHNLGVFFFLH